MASKLQITDEAVLEIDDALKYYRNISIELSFDLELKYYRLDWVLQQPFAMPAIRAGFRKINVERFPYKIVYYVSSDTVVVIAFQHHKRRPFYWQGRQIL